MGVPARIAISSPLWRLLKYCVIVPLTGHMKLPVPDLGLLLALGCGWGCGFGVGLGGGGFTLAGGALDSDDGLLLVFGGSGTVTGWRSGGRTSPRALGSSRAGGANRAAATTCCCGLPPGTMIT